MGQNVIGGWAPSGPGKGSVSLHFPYCEIARTRRCSTAPRSPVKGREGKEERRWLVRRGEVRKGKERRKEGGTKGERQEIEFGHLLTKFRMRYATGRTGHF